MNVLSNVHPGHRFRDVETRIAAWAGGPSQPVWDSLRTYADSLEVRKSDQTCSIFLSCVFTLSFRKAVMPA